MTVSARIYFDWVVFYVFYHFTSNKYVDSKKLLNSFKKIFIW